MNDKDITLYGIYANPFLDFEKKLIRINRQITIGNIIDETDNPQKTLTQLFNDEISVHIGGYKTSHNLDYVDLLF
jgi:hypothetical protein